MNCTPRVRMERARLQDNWRFGFTLLELMVALVLIGILATIVIPNMRRKAADQDQKNLANYLNAVSQFAMQRAIETYRVHKVVLDLSKRSIFLEVQSPKKDKKDSFERVKSSFLRTEFNWEPNLVFKNIYIEKEDKMKIVGKLAQTWFFILPDGLGQPVVLNIIDVKDTRKSAKGKEFSLVLNPFTLQFKNYDSFQKP